MINFTKTNGAVITTLIPTYQRSALLERSIRSVLGQTYPHLQVRVYDNASGDETRETVERLAMADPRVSYFCHATNIGATKNFIYAMEGVDTPFFSLLSDDDILLPRFYETAMRGFGNHPEAMLSATATLQMDEAGRILGAPLLKWKRGLYQPPEGFIAMLDQLHPEWTSVVFRREVLQEVGAIDEETGAAGDLDYELRVAARFPMVVSNEPGAIFVAHPGSSSSSPRLCGTWPGWLKMIQNQTEDERIPVKARVHARQVLTERLKEKLFVTYGFGSLLRQNWQDSLQAARLLRSEYGLWGRAFILVVATSVCQRLPPARRAVVAFYNVRRLMTRLRQRPVQRRLGAYGAHLNTTSSPAK